MCRWLAVICGLLALAADWPWGDFQGHTHWANVGWIPFVSPPVRPLDMLENLLLFAPFGLFVALGHRRPARRAVGRAALMAAGIGFLGEWSQLYSHTRFPSATDLVCNVLGATLAAAVVTYPVARDILPSS